MTEQSLSLPKNRRRARRSSLSSEKRLERKKRAEVSLLLDQAENYWIRYCAAMDSAERMLSSPTHASAVQRTMLPRAVEMSKRARLVSGRRWHRLADLEALSLLWEIPRHLRSLAQK
jgi:hypothetical protein